MMTVLVSGKASPGVTTATWALALSWPGEVLAVDCDAQGGDMAPGLLLGRSQIETGLWTWNPATRRSAVPDAAATLLDHVVALPEARQVLMLPGFQTGEQARGMDHAGWDRLARALCHVSATSSRDVVVDAGRVQPGMCWPLVAAADKVLLVCGRSGRSVHWARNAVPQLVDHLGDTSKLALVLVGKSGYNAPAISAAVGAPVAGELPHDPDTAAVLTDGAPVRVLGIGRTPLMREAAKLVAYLGGLGYTARTSGAAAVAGAP